MVPTDIPSGAATVVVLAYEDGEWSDAEDDEPSGEDVRFPGAVTSVSLSDDHTYRLSLLAAGDYDLAVATFGADGSYLEMWGFVDGVSVTAGRGTTQNIDAGILAASLP